MLLRAQRIIVRGRAQHHAVDCGFGSSPLLPLTSGVEINFRETAQGQRRRGATPLHAYYAVRQSIASELLMERIGPTLWTVVAAQTAPEADDPDQATVVFDATRGVVSTVDTPGFVFTPGVEGVPRSPRTAISTRASGVSLQQNFRTWVARETSEVSDPVVWHHFLLLERTPGHPWAVNRRRSSLGPGRRDHTDHLGP